jgi:acyl-CoA reductase-like NAD-dependent aldehyde dehydrogenase
MPFTSGKNFANYYPITGEILGYFPLSGESDANAAVAAALATFEKWRLVPTSKGASESQFERHEAS